MTEEFFAKLFERKNGIKLGIGRVAEAFPQIKTREIPVYHVAGTNGKGTVVYSISHILTQNGLKTGRFISPHIFSYNERIAVDGRNISDPEIIDIYSELERTVDNFEELSFFEITFLVAWKHFENEKCDRVVIEVGLGGRIDATNVIDWPKTDVVTSIGLDHTHILGETVEEIAVEKLGIVKKGDIVILPVMAQKGLREWMISRIREIKDVDLYSVDDIFSKEGTSRSIVQIMNMNIAATAVLKTEGTRHIPHEESFYFPGRYEQIENNVFIDVAHNPPAVQTLVDHIASMNTKMVVVYGAMKDKDVGKCLGILANIAEKIFPVSLNVMNRGADVKYIVDRSGESVKDLFLYGKNDDETLKKAYLYSKEKGLKLLVTGSFYTIEKYVEWRRNADCN